MTTAWIDNVGEALSKSLAYHGHSFPVVNVREDDDLVDGVCVACTKICEQCDRLIKTRSITMQDSEHISFVAFTARTPYPAVVTADQSSVASAGGAAANQRKRSKSERSSLSVPPRGAKKRREETSAPTTARGV